MGPTTKKFTTSLRWAAVTGLGCGLGWLALYAVLRLLGVRDPTAPSIVSGAAPAFIFVVLWILSAIKQATTREQWVWTYLVVYRKPITVVVVVVLIFLAVLAVDRAIAAGVARMLVGLAVILAIIGALLGGFLANADLAAFKRLK